MCANTPIPEHRGTVNSTTLTPISMLDIAEVYQFINASINLEYDLITAQ